MRQEELTDLSDALERCRRHRDELRAAGADLATLVHLLIQSGQVDGALEPGCHRALDHWQAVA